MTESHATPSRLKAPITDKLWFWLLVYGGMAVLALAAIAPKHFKRQERLDRMGNARQEVWRKKVEGRPLIDIEDAPRDAAPSAPDGTATSEALEVESLDDKQPKTRPFDPSPMLLIVAAVVWLAGSMTVIYLPRLSRRYYPRFMHDSSRTNAVNEIRS